MQRLAIRCAFISLLLSSLLDSARAASDPDTGSDLPNILWITSEDNSFEWLGSYDNEQAHTPRLDALAKGGIQFNRAYSNAPVCAVARSTLLFSNYAVTMGTQHMRSRYKIPQKLKPYVHYLRSLGYYCTNNSKTDYNRAGNDRRIWNQCDNRAHYKNRPKGSPFFAIFNLTICHESSLFPKRVASNRKQGAIPKQSRLSPSEVELPPYLPDIPEMRSDFAIYHDNVTAMDKGVGALLDELKAQGLAEDTIVFYYSDHGGPTPRGKRYLTDTGTRVPLIVHFPEKWQHLSPFSSGEQVDELVAFVDFAPTILSLCGMERPKQMQGRPFLGPYRMEPAKDAEVFLFGDRFDELLGMRRGITDGRFKYIRCFTPYYPAAPYSYYSFGMPSWKAWQEAWESGKLADEFNALWEAPQPNERLYDLTADPWEINNLADDPQHAERLKAMKDRLKRKMIESYDTGLICEPLFDSVAGEGTVYKFAHGAAFDAQEVADLAFLASEGDRENLPNLMAAMMKDNSIHQYWGIVGCTVLGEQASAAKMQISELLSHAEPVIRISAAYALHELGEIEKGKQALIAELDEPIGNAAGLMLVQSISMVDAFDDVPRKWIKKTLEEPGADVYLKRFAGRLKQGS